MVDVEVTFKMSPEWVENTDMITALVEHLGEKSSSGICFTTQTRDITYTLNSPDDIAEFDGVIASLRGRIPDIDWVVLDSEEYFIDEDC